MAPFLLYKHYMKKNILSLVVLLTFALALGTGALASLDSSDDEADFNTAHESCEALLPFLPDDRQDLFTHRWAQNAQIDIKIGASIPKKFHSEIKAGLDLWNEVLGEQKLVLQPGLSFGDMRSVNTIAMVSPSAVDENGNVILADSYWVAGTTQLRAVPELPPANRLASGAIDVKALPLGGGSTAVSSLPLVGGGAIDVSSLPLRIKEADIYFNNTKIWLTQGEFEAKLEAGEKLEKGSTLFMGSFLHEVGHLLGLSHVDDKRSLMYPEASKDDQHQPGARIHDQRTEIPKFDAKYAQCLYSSFGDRPLSEYKKQKKQPSDESLAETRATEDEVAKTGVAEAGAAKTGAVEAGVAEAGAAEAGAKVSDDDRRKAEAAARVEALAKRRAEAEARRKAAAEAQAKRRAEAEARAAAAAAEVEAEKKRQQLKEEMGRILVSAVEEGRLEKVKTLIQLGADVNHRSDDGRTFVQVARDHGHGEVEQFFLDKMNPLQVALHHVESFLGNQFGCVEKFVSDLFN